MVLSQDRVLPFAKQSPMATSRTPLDLTTQPAQLDRKLTLMELVVIHVVIVTLLPARILCNPLVVVALKRPGMECTVKHALLEPQAAMDKTNPVTLLVLVIIKVDAMDLILAVVHLKVDSGLLAKMLKPVLKVLQDKPPPLLIEKVAFLALLMIPVHQLEDLYVIPHGVTLS